MSGLTLPRRQRPRAAALLSLALLAGLIGAPAAAAATGPAAERPTTVATDAIHRSDSHLVTAAPEAYESMLAALRAVGAIPTRTMPELGMAAVDLSPSAARTLRRDPSVAGVSPDADLTLQTSVYDPKADVNSMHNIAKTMGAYAIWTKPSGAENVTGRGVDVALLDSGVTPVPGLDAPGKLVHGPDLSFDSQSPDFRNLDGFGHGTHMAGIIAGRDAGVQLKAPDSAFVGMAPNARIVSVKVADAWGNTDVSQVIAGIDWVVKHRADPGFNIRVLNLSLGTPSMQDYTLDPLAHAAEVAWRKGIVVVAAVGNDGTGTGKVLNPAQDPYVLAVGATDSKGTNPTDDDVIPAFSNRGDGVRNPDLVTAGTSVQSLRVPGSYIDQQYGATAAINERYIRGSGTSQAAAVASGAVALLLEWQPTLRPDGVKELLMGGARALPAADAQAQGKGVLDVRRSVDGRVVKVSGKTQGWTTSKGSGSLHRARGGYLVETPDGVALTGEQDIFAKAYAGDSHGLKQQEETAWSGGTWNSSDWTGSAWTDAGWAGNSWSGVDWTGKAWAGKAWAGGTWTGKAWADGYWSGKAWAGKSWAGKAWASGGWR